MISTIDDTQQRRLKLLEIVNQFREQVKLINRYTLQPELEKQGFKVSFATIYRDMTSINQKNTWVRDLAQSNYSAYQESISQNLEWIEQHSAKAELVRELIEQLKHEEMLLTPSGRESFDHPTGRNNDMGMAWELSIHGCIQLGLEVDMPGNVIDSQMIETPEINYAMGNF